NAGGNPARSVGFGRGRARSRPSGRDAARHRRAGDAAFRRSGGPAASAHCRRRGDGAATAEREARDFARARNCYDETDAESALARRDSRQITVDVSNRPDAQATTRTADRRITGRS
ncbi:MAG TPA: hypothetical protein VIM81_06865, partial [Gammaproteobacteria bacterium]